MLKRQQLPLDLFFFKCVSVLHPCVVSCVCLCWACARVAYIAGSSAAGRWTAWPWRDKRTMASPCRWTPSSCRPLGSWAGGPVSAPSLTTSSGNTEHTSCSRLHWEVNTVIWCHAWGFWHPGVPEKKKKKDWRRFSKTYRNILMKHVAESFSAEMNERHILLAEDFFRRETMCFTFPVKPVYLNWAN